MRAVIDYFKKAYSGGVLKQGKIAIHEAKEVYISLSDRKTARVLTDTDTNWLKPTLTNGWEVYDEDVAYRIDSLGILHIKGTARYGALNYAIFQLPQSHRPSRNISLVVLMREGHGRLDINTNGYVIPRGTEELVYDDNGNPTGGIIEVGYLSLECGVMI